LKQNIAHTFAKLAEEELIKFQSELFQVMVKAWVRCRNCACYLSVTFMLYIV